MSEIHAALKLLEDATRQLVRLPVPEGGVAADVTGRVRHVEINLADYRRGLLSETEPAEGRDYEIVVTNRGVRSYNSARILSDAAAGLGQDLVATVQELVGKGVLRLSWGWQKLEQFFKVNRIELVVASNREVVDAGDLDEPHVGVVWKRDTTVKAKIKEDDDGEGTEIPAGGEHH